MYIKTLGGRSKGEGIYQQILVCDKPETNPAGHHIFSSLNYVGSECLQRRQWWQMKGDNLRQITAMISSGKLKVADRTRGFKEI